MPFQERQPTMKDQNDKRESQTGAPAKSPKKESRQDRLKLALRENLKRRKSQARGRSAVTVAASDDVGVSDDADGKKPSQ
jgi:hypothetical protein